MTFPDLPVPLQFFYTVCRFRHFSLLQLQSGALRVLSTYCLFCNVQCGVHEEASDNTSCRTSGFASEEDPFLSCCFCRKLALGECCVTCQNRLAVFTEHKDNAIFNNSLHVPMMKAQRSGDQVDLRLVFELVRGNHVLQHSDFTAPWREYLASTEGLKVLMTKEGQRQFELDGNVLDYRELGIQELPSFKAIIEVRVQSSVIVADCWFS